MITKRDDRHKKKKPVKLIRLLLILRPKNFIYELDDVCIQFFT